MEAFLLIWGVFQGLGFVCSQSCVQLEDYVCSTVPSGYPPGLTSLVFFAVNMGEINSTVFNSTDLSSVTRLTVTQCAVTSIAPGAFAQFKNLKMLNLQNNRLSQVNSDWFLHKGVLETLILINNNITALNGNSFAGLVGLSDLDLSQNLIHSITSDSFSFLLRLSDLNLSHNKLRRLSVDTLMPLKNTKMLLHENPWDCSCSVYEFSLYLRELQRLSLLRNERVLCDCPAHQRGKPVWNVSKCVNSVTDVALSNGNSQNFTSGSTNQATIISLVVVLCALVLVICVLSVLYHRKQEKKHRLAVRPFPEEQDNSIQPDCRASAEMTEKVESISCDQRRQEQTCNNRLLLKLDQTLLESQIYQIYSRGIHQTREMTGRAKSAEPVLSRTDGSERRPHSEVEDRGVGRGKAQAVHDGWTEAELKVKENEYVRKEEAGKTEVKKHIERQDEEFLTALADGGEKDKHILEGNVKDQEFLHCEMPSEEDDSDDDEYNLSSSSARSQPPQEHADDLQPMGDVENIPYLTIGADSEKQSPNTEQICNTKASTGQLNLRPIRRTLSWPPTAAQWKKQWAQAQQVLSISPKLVFVTQYEYHLGMFPTGISSAVPENIPQASCSGFPKQQLQIKDSVHLESVEPSIQTGEFINRSCIKELETRDYNEVDEDFIRPQINKEARSDSVTIKPLCEGMGSKATSEVKVRSSNTNQSLKDKQSRAVMGRKPKGVARDGRKDLRSRQRDQSHSSSGAHPSGGSPSDDRLLVDNDYTFIDLLHEVVENHGRWTRESRRQNHTNKAKRKPVGKS